MDKLMNLSFKNTIVTLGLFFIFIGIVFLTVENTFYQYLDENLVLHESLFLPLGVLTIIIGTLLLVYSVLKKTFKSLNKRS